MVKHTILDQLLHSNVPDKNCTFWHEILFNISEILDSKIKSHGHNMTKDGTKYYFGSHDWIWSDAHYIGGLWRPMCDLGILSQPAGKGIPLTLQCWLLSVFYFQQSSYITGLSGITEHSWANGFSLIFEYFGIRSSWL